MYSKEVKNIVQEMLEAPRLCLWTRNIKNKNKLYILIKETSFLKNTAKVSERIFCVQNNIQKRMSCSNCDIQVHFNRNKKKYNKYCPSCSRKTEKFIKKFKQTNLERYGVENYAQTKEFIKKFKQTNLEKYGVEHYTQTNEYKERAKQTNLEKYGVINPFQSEQIKEKIKQSNLERYGVEYYAQAKECHDKMKQTSLERYGVEHYTQTNECQEKIKQTNLEKYGVEHYTQTREFYDKIKQTNLERYGVEHYAQTKEYKEKIKQANLEKYGVEYYSQTDEYKEKIKQTNLERYGVENYAQTNEYKEKVKQTNLEKYGVEYYTQKHIPQEILDKLNNKDWLYDEHVIKEKPLMQISNELNLSPTIASRYLKKHNIEAQYFNVSQQEKELQEYISSLTTNVITNTRSVISPLELDIYLPDHNIAFEFNGLYWHSHSKLNDKFYHVNKTNACKEQGIRLIHIFEHEWLFKQNIVKSMINSSLDLNKIIYANKCQIKEIDYNETKSFLDRTHIQGNLISKIQIGLFHEDQLVSVMTFSRFNNEYELLRFGSELNIDVVGAESKLFKYFIQQYKPGSVISYNNLRYGNDDIYNKFGFECSHIIEPDYFYFKGYELITKNQLFEKFDSNLTEYQIITEHGLDKIYDCGYQTWVYENKFNKEWLEKT